MTTTKMIEAKQVSKMIDGQTILNEINFSLDSGSIHGIVGSNGAGKTTLLRLLNGVYQPSSGYVLVFGQPLIGDAVSIRQRVHLVNADGAFYPGFRVRDLFKYASLLYQKWDNERVNTLVKTLEIPLHQPIRKLSLGMKMQVRLAVALASRPEILLLDEPTNGLDPIVRRQFLSLIVQEVAGTGMSVVLATHRLEELEAVADHISVLHHGKLVLSGSIEDFKTNYHEVIAVMSGDITKEIMDYPGILSVHAHGKIQSFVMKGNTSEFILKLTRAGALHVDEQPVEFETLFRAIMEKEGYTRDAILLS